MNYLNKLRMAAGIPINAADEKVTKPETITEMSYEDEEMSGEDMRRIKKQVTKTMFELEAEADKQKDRGQKAMYMGDAADYENVFKAMSDGNQKKARKLFNAMDTAARDAAFDKGPKNSLGLLASYLGIERKELDENWETDEMAHRKNPAPKSKNEKFKVGETYNTKLGKIKITRWQDANPWSPYGHFDIILAGIKATADFGELEDIIEKGNVPKSRFVDFLDRNPKLKDLVKKGPIVNEDYGSPHSEDEEDTAAKYSKGQYVIYKGEKYCVEVPDAQSDFVGIIPDELKDASDEKRNSAVDLVHSKNLSKPEDEEVAVDPDMAPRDGETEITLSFESPEPPAADYARASEALRKVNVEAGIKPGSVEVSETGDITFDTDEHGKYVVRKNESKAEELKEEAVPATVWDTMPEDKDESPESSEGDVRKIIVPAEVKTALKKEIEELNKGAAEFKVRDLARANFYSDTAEALEGILDCLDKGNVDEMKKAQVFMTSLMGPMVQRIPDVAYEFLVRGGEPRTLKTLFHDVKMKKQGE